jgi:hypothetical protein
VSSGCHIVSDNHVGRLSDAAASASVNVPVAPANRPVPPTIVATSVTCETFGGVNASCPPAVAVNSWSLFAAVRLKVPVLVAAGWSTTSTNVAVKRPRWGAVTLGGPSDREGRRNNLAAGERRE